MIIDSHAHYDDEKFDEDRETLLSGLKDHGIECVVNIASNLDTVKKTLELTREYPFIYGTVGVHPEEAAELTNESFKWLEEQCNQPKIVAVGEIGLDYYWDEPEPDIQKIWFERQIEMAKINQLPMVIHSRDAAKDTLDFMKGCGAEEAGGVIHCFSYSIEMAREFLNMGFYLGIGGVVTFKNAKKLHEVVKYAPLDRILIETDCPYLSPEPNRGKRNSSLNLDYVVKEIAKIKKADYEEIVNITAKNAKDMYRLPIE